MPLNMNDPNVVAEVQPPQVIDLGTKLKTYYQVGGANFGIKGDENHLSGYHRSRNTLVNTPGASGSGDYSIQQPLDTQNMSWNDCCACDLTPHSWGSAENNRRMIDSTNRMYAAAKKLDPRIQQCREFAGTFDGRTVVRFRCDGGAIQSPFDSSHLEHWHISFWRSRVRWNHQGLYEVITGDGMLTPNQAQQLINVHDWIYDLCRGLITADPGTAHITKYVPNEILKTLQDRPPVQSAPVDVAALAAALAADTTFINAIADAVLAGLPTHDERVQESFEGAQRAENE